MAAFAFIESDQTRRIKPSATLAVNNLALELKAKFSDVIGFAVGEPDKATPGFVGDGMATFARQGQNKYSKPNDPKLVAPIIEKFREDNGLVFNEQEITTGVCGKELVFWGIGTAINPGDDVVIPAPYWVSYPEIVNYFGGTPRIVVPSRTDLKITPEELRAALTPKTRLFIINQPSNPAGVVYSKQELLALAEVLREASKTNPNLVIITDDIYEKLVYGVEFFTLPQLAPDLKERCLVINGISKSHSFTGGRFGFCGGPAAWIKSINKMISQSSTHGPTVVHAGAIAALTGPDDFLVEWCADYVRRRDYVLGRLEVMGIPCSRPDGAFYVFPNISQVLGKSSDGVQINTDEDFVMTFLRQKHVACVHGSAFGMPGYMRISYATSDENLEAGLDRMAEFIRNLRQRAA
ncbi:MAG: pyridoxal phosphate-dependent aminotransferase [Alphaproteobacteria bacterium]|nr:MAG: pyridoxal phosphate-dependent aminotransferase [Alphaproteobacteria bacterium]